MTRFQPAALPLRLHISVTDSWQLLSLLAFVAACVLPVGLVLAGNPAATEGSASSSLAGGLPVVGGSAVTALAAVVAGTAFGAPLGEARRRTAGFLGTALEVGMLLPLLLPPVAFALGVRALLQSAGLESLVRGDASTVLSAVPVVLAQTCVTTSIVAVAWTCWRPRSARGERQHVEDAALVLGLNSFDRWRSAEGRGALGAVVAGSAVTFLHAFTSVAAPAVFPAAHVPSLPLEVLRGTFGGPRFAATAVPLVVTLPVLWLALRRSAPISTPADLGARPSSLPWAGIGIAVLTARVSALAAMLARGLTPEAIVALRRAPEASRSPRPSVGRCCSPWRPRAARFFQSRSR
ncbi:MAG: hypothetical protein U0360_09095 [Dehalococcoidia bacterium]